jgi:hypothetical protein
LRAIESAGGQINGFATEELSLEDIYMRYVGEEQSRDPKSTAGSK